MSRPRQPRRRIRQQPGDAGRHRSTMLSSAIRRRPYRASVGAACNGARGCATRRLLDGGEDQRGRARLVRRKSGLGGYSCLWRGVRAPPFAAASAGVRVFAPAPATPAPAPFPSLLELRRSRGQSRSNGTRPDGQSHDCMRAVARIGWTITRSDQPGVCVVLGNCVWCVRRTPVGDCAARRTHPFRVMSVASAGPSLAEKPGPP